MTTFNIRTLPMAVFARPGTQVSLDRILRGSFGGRPGDTGYYFITHSDATDMQNGNYGFWEPGTPTADVWSKNGKDIGSGWDHQTGVGASETGAVTLTVGNAVGAFANLTIQSGPDAYTQYSVTTIDPSLKLASAGLRAPTAEEIVAQAHRFDEKYGAIHNPNDCHYIAASVAASAGATLADGATQSLNPAENIENGFWRIAYRGSDVGAVANWQTLVRPGDIVRMGWTSGGFHTVTVLGASADAQTITVYDNGNSSLGIHEGNYAGGTIASTITIYRLTTDNLYLQTGADEADALPGTVFNDQTFGLAGDDALFGAAGDDRLFGGAGLDRLRGGDGADRLDGGADGDRLFGGRGDDTYVVDDRHDVVDEHGGDGIDTIESGVTLSLATTSRYRGEIENVTLTGSSNLNATGNGLDNHLTGNGGANGLYGGAGADWLDGGLGRDRLTGGEDADTFAFTTAIRGGNVDRIGDFASGSDHLALDDAIFGALHAVGGSLDPAQFASIEAGERYGDDVRIVFDRSTGTLFYDADGFGGAKAVVFATLADAHPIVASDILVI